MIEQPIKIHYHSPLGASKAHRWARCSASVWATAWVPDIQTQAALDGTIAHERGAQMILGVIGDEPVLNITQVEPDWIEPLEAYRDYVLGFYDPATDFIYVEHTVPIAHITGIEDDTGSSDVVIVKPTELHVFDLKFGVGDLVASEDAKEDYMRRNPQLTMYADGVLRDFDWMLPSDEKFPVILHIFQPRRDHISVVNTTRNAVRSMADFLNYRAALTRSPEAPFNPGEKQCRWCPIRGSCKARMEWVLEPFEEYESVQSEDADASNWLAPTVLADEQLKSVGERANAMKRWMADVLQEIGKRTQDGKDVGYKFVRGQSRRTITETGETELEKLVGKKAYTTPEPELVGIGVAEKLLGKKHAFFAIENGFIEKPDGPLKLVPSSDGRTGVSVDKTDAFSIETGE